MDFIKVGAASPKLKISDTKYNLKEIETMILNAIEEEVKVLVFPELSISAYSCGDLFTNEKLIENCNLAIKNLVEFSKGKDILIAVGAPFLYRYSLYNCAYIILNGELLGIVPKSYIPNYSEFYEKRWFTEGFNIKGLNVELIDFVFNEDEEIFNSNVDKINSIIQNSINSKTNEILNNNEYIPPSNGGSNLNRDEEILKKILGIK